MARGNFKKWTDEMIEDLRTLKAKGYAATQIAREITMNHGRPLSRSAVLGQAHRLRLGAWKSNQPRTRASREARYGGVKSSKRLKGPKNPVTLNPEHAPEAHTLGTTQEPTGCRFVYGDVRAGKWSYCGSAIDPARPRPYCSDCYDKLERPDVENPIRAARR